MRGFKLTTTAHLFYPIPTLKGENLHATIISSNNNIEWHFCFSGDFSCSYIVLFSLEPIEFVL